ncbi:MAG: FHA domain-containing protein [Verrucomicrobiales bacterium]
MPVIEFTKGPLQPKRFELDENGVTFGRAYETDIQIASDTRVSSQHAMIKFEKGQWWLYDLGSSNGTAVNGQRVEAAVLQPGDVVALGDSRFTYQSDGHPPRPPGAKRSRRPSRPRGGIFRSRGTMPISSAH